MPPVTWKSIVRNLVFDYCNRIGSRSFTLTDLYVATDEELAAFAPSNNNRRDKLRQVLQVLRDEGLVTFVDGRGNYTLRGVELLVDEVEDPAVIEAVRGNPEKREYLIEVFARDRGWAAEARQKFGTACFCDQCTNVFLKEDGKPYCEVHHIQPLHEGGEDAVYNLSILCAHHHKMAHFAAANARHQLRDFLEAKTNSLLAL